MPTPELCISDAAPFTVYSGGNVVALRASNYMAASRATLTSVSDALASSKTSVRETQRTTQTGTIGTVADRLARYNEAQDTLLIDFSTLPLKTTHGYSLLFSVRTLGPMDARVLGYSRGDDFTVIDNTYAVIAGNGLNNNTTIGPSTFHAAGGPFYSGGSFAQMPTQRIESYQYILLNEDFKITANTDDFTRTINIRAYWVGVGTGTICIETIIFVANSAPALYTIIRGGLGSVWQSTVTNVLNQEVGSFVALETDVRTELDLNHKSIRPGAASGLDEITREYQHATNGLSSSPPLERIRNILIGDSQLLFLGGTRYIPPHTVTTDTFSSGSNWDGSFTSDGQYQWVKTVGGFLHALISSGKGVLRLGTTNLGGNIGSSKIEMSLGDSPVGGGIFLSGNDGLDITATATFSASPNIACDFAEMCFTGYVQTTGAQPGNQNYFLRTYTKLVARWEGGGTVTWRLFFYVDDPSAGAPTTGGPPRLTEYSVASGTLVSGTFTPSTDSIKFRLRRDGYRIRGKIWLGSSSEPSSWMGDGYTPGFQFIRSPWSTVFTNDPYVGYPNPGYQYAVGPDAFTIQCPMLGGIGLNSTFFITNWDDFQADYISAGTVGDGHLGVIDSTTSQILINDLTFPYGSQYLADLGHRPWNHSFYTWVDGSADKEHWAFPIGYWHEFSPLGTVASYSMVPLL